MEIQNLTNDQVNKIKAAKSLEELKAAAKEQGVFVSDEELTFAWNSLHKKDAVEISEDELENVAGGCGSKAPKGIAHFYCNPCERNTYVECEEGKYKPGDSYPCCACGKPAPFQSWLDFG